MTKTSTQYNLVRLFTIPIDKYVKYISGIIMRQYREITPSCVPILCNYMTQNKYTIVIKENF